MLETSTAPLRSGRMRIGRAPIGSVVRWEDSVHVGRVVEQRGAHTIVAKRAIPHFAFTPTSGPMAGLLVTLDSSFLRPESVDPATIVRVE